MKYRDVGVDIDKHWAVHREAARRLGAPRASTPGGWRWAAWRLRFT